MQTYPSSCRGSPRQWELRKIPSFPVIDADYWSDASLSLPHLASALPRDEDKERVFISRCPQNNDQAIQSTQYKEISSQMDQPIKARGGRFPPPLDSPALMYEERYSHLESLERVSFTSVRSNGRLLVTETPRDAHPRRRLHSHRRNGRLLLQLVVERSTRSEECPIAAEAAEGYDPLANKGNASAEEDTIMNPTARKAKAMKASSILADEELQHEAEDEGGDNDNGKVRLYTKVLKTLECDVFSNDSAEAFSLVQPHVKNGRSSGVASFLQSLTRVRPLNVLSIWQA